MPGKMDWKTVIKNIRNVFFSENHVCPWWLAYTFDNPLRPLLHDPERILGSSVKQGMTVADIGCGMGYFSLALAEMVGPNGKVLAVDVQQKMLDAVRRRAAKRGIADRIRLVHAGEDDIGIKEPVDFVLMFWMVHETGDRAHFLGRVASVLKKAGSALIAEPKMHVTARSFRETVEYARKSGFTVQPGPPVRISRSALLRKS